MLFRSLNLWTRKIIRHVVDGSSMGRAHRFFRRSKESTPSYKKSFWVIREGRKWPSPETYYSVLYPNPDSGNPERYVAAFLYKQDCVSSMPIPPPDPNVFERNLHRPTVLRFSAEKLCPDYLHKCTLSGAGIVVFDADISYMDPCLILPPVHECCLEVRDELDNLLSVPYSP
jgi:hypothetical protein